MKFQLLFSLKLALYTWVVFTLGRLAFILAYIPLFSSVDASFGEVLSIFYYSFPLDISTFAYIYIFPFLVLTLTGIFPKKFWKYIMDVYMFLITLLYSLVVAGEIGIYDEWRSKLSFKALVYLQNPSEVFNSTSTWSFVALVGFVIVFTGGLFWAYRKWVSCHFTKTVKWYSIVIYFILTPFLWLVAARGGLKEIPISQSQSFFSNKQILNDVCANPIWNFSHNIANSIGVLEHNPYIFYPQEEALKTVKDLHFAQDSTLSILSSTQPNIVIILLESWSADALQTLTGDSVNFTPCFQALEKEGLLFTQAYAGGKRSQQGIAAIYAGYPALPQVVITNYPEKSRKLPSLSKALKKEGYHTSFYFGGELIYGNILSFLHSCDFDKIFEAKNVKENIKRGKLGYHDEFMYHKHIQELEHTPTPFFTSLFTVSSHSPFDQPMKDKFDLDIPEIRYLNSVYYSDSCLGAYLKEAKTQAWYDNTLFIILGDHSHESHKRNPYFSFEANRIPMLFYGNVLKPEYKGKQFTSLVGQTDIPATILKFIGANSSDFTWSRNIFNPNVKEFVYMEAQTGVGLKTPLGHFFLLKEGENNRIISDDLLPESRDSILRVGKSYLQVLYEGVMGM